MVRPKITYYKMLTSERRVEIAVAVGATDLRSQARFAAGQSLSSLEPSSEEEEAGPMFIVEVPAQKAPDVYETMDVDFVPASGSPMVQADQRFNLAILKEDREAEAQLDAERADAAAIEALLQAEPDVVDVNQAAEAQLDTEHADAAAIEALLQAEPDVLDLNRAAEAQLNTERANAAAIEALLQAEPVVLDLNRAVLASVQSARTLRVNE
jgi:DNA repair exonuclease SbcCD ATPase subunit